MIVTFDWPIKTLAGINHDRTIVYRSCRNHSVCIASVYVCPRITEHNHRQGSKLTQANILYKSINATFKEELKRYADAFNNQLCLKEKLYVNYYNVFIKALCNGKVQIEDLSSVSRFVELHGNNIESWIANGLLPKVKAKFSGVEAWVVEEYEEYESFNDFAGQVETVREEHESCGRMVVFVFARRGGIIKELFYERDLSPP